MIAEDDAQNMGTENKPQQQVERGNPGGEEADKSFFHENGPGRDAQGVGRQQVFPGAE